MARARLRALTSAERGARHKRRGLARRRRRLHVGERPRGLLGGRRLRDRGAPPPAVALEADAQQRAQQQPAQQRRNRRRVRTRGRRLARAHRRAALLRPRRRRRRRRQATRGGASGTSAAAGGGERRFRRRRFAFGAAAVAASASISAGGGGGGGDSGGGDARLGFAPSSSSCAFNRKIGSASCDRHRPPLLPLGPVCPPGPRPSCWPTPRARRQLGRHRSPDLSEAKARGSSSKLLSVGGRVATLLLAGSRRHKFSCRSDNHGRGPTNPLRGARRLHPGRVARGGARGVRAHPRAGSRRRRRVPLQADLADRAGPVRGGGAGGGGARRARGGARVRARVLPVPAQPRARRRSRCSTRRGSTSRGTRSSRRRSASGSASTRARPSSSRWRRARRAAAPSRA